GTPPTGAPVEDEDSATVTTEDPDPGIALSKSTTSTPERAGQSISYDFVVTNTGNVTLTDVAFTDSLLGVSAVPAGAVWSAGSSPASGLAPGGTVSFALEHPVTQAEVDAGEVENAAAVSGTPPSGAPVEDDDAVTVTITPDPS